MIFRSLTDRLRDLGGWFGRPSLSGEAGQSTAIHPPTLKLCPAVGLRSTDDDIPAGHWPDDLDAIPAWINRLVDRGIEPICHTRRQVEEAIAKCKLALEDQPKPKALPVTTETQTAPEAAVAFLRWMRGEKLTGRFTDAELSANYTAYCDARPNLIPASEAHMRKHLKDLGGVTKMLDKDPSAPKRRRPTVWIISPALADSVRRMAA